MGVELHNPPPPLHNYVTDYLCLAKIENLQK